jgi:broad specificity phosphatase PhoE
MKLYLVRHGQSTGNIGGTLMGQSDHPLTPLGEVQARAVAGRLAPVGPMPVFSSDLPRARTTAEYIVGAWMAGGGAEATVERPASLTLDRRLREISLGDYEGRPWQEFEADTALTEAFTADPYGTALPNGESLEHLEARVHAAVLDILEPFGVDETGAYCGNAVSQGDASATDRNANADADRAMKADAAAAAVDGAAAAVAAEDASGADDGLPETMDASAVATGFLPVADGDSACLVAHDGPIRAILNHYLGVPPEKWWTLSTTHGGVSLLEFAGGCVTIRFVNATGHLAGLEPDKYVPSDGD